MESAAIAASAAAAPVDTSAPGAKGLKAGAIGYMSNLVIAVASTAPAYSLATTLGFFAVYRFTFAACWNRRAERLTELALRLAVR